MSMKLLLQGLFHHLSQRLNKQRRRIQRLSTGKLNAVLFGLLTRTNLNIVENLKMISQELNRSNQDMCVTCRLEFGHEIGEVRLEPFFGRVTGTLVAEHPPVGGQTSLLSNGSGRLPEIMNIVGFPFNDPFGHTM